MNGPPLRFKAVDIDTGYESGPFDLKFEDCDGGRACVPLGIGEKLYQFTGHHDANGKEVFFGDVLFKPWPIPTFFRVELRFDQIRLVQWARYDENMALIGGAHSEYNIKGSAHLVYCIGNIHTPPEQLQAAAEKVRTERD